MLTIRAMSDGKGYLSRHLEHSDYYAEGELVVGLDDELDAGRAEREADDPEVRAGERGHDRAVEGGVGAAAAQRAERAGDARGDVDRVARCELGAGLVWLARDRAACGPARASSRASPAA